ncbi:MAG: hypothetical protein MSG64_14315 [Pyrinomonadaceae bacterium MAG19_C2-C3]|nr:hypothetical protein [Pyrinomonadaceae bacterium MAG19_C2-C3]
MGGWNPSPYTLHFAAEFSQPFKSFGTWRNEDAYPNTANVTGEQTAVGVYVTFDPKDARQIEVKTGVSFVSPEKAHAEISRGGKLVLQMSDKSASWANAKRPPSMSTP